MFEDDNYVYTDEESEEEEDDRTECTYPENDIELSIIWEESSSDLKSSATYSIANSRRHLPDNVPFPQTSRHSGEACEGLLDVSPRQRVSMKSLDTGELISFSIHSDGEFTFESCSTLGVSTASPDDSSADSSIPGGSFAEADPDQLLPFEETNTSPQLGAFKKKDIKKASMKNMPSSRNSTTPDTTSKDVISFEISPRTPAEMLRLEAHQEKVISGRQTHCIKSEDENLTPKRKNAKPAPKANFKRIDFAGSLVASEDRVAKRKQILTANMTRGAESMETGTDALSPPPPPPPPMKSPRTRTPPQRSKSEGDYLSKQRRKLARAHEKFKDATKKIIKLIH
eukprot:scaffold620_cov103-Cylindrotheca_fusiformis.AAC.5